MGESVAVHEKVWLGFMDGVPVVGKVKEVVEWILALYNGDKALIEEKNKILTNILQNPEELMRKMTLTETPEAAGASRSGSAGLKKVKVEKLHEYVDKGRSEAKKPQKLEGIQEIIQKNVKSLGLNSTLVKLLMDELERNKGDRQVFSQDIITLHSNLLEEFKKQEASITHLNFNKTEIYKTVRPNVDLKKLKKIQKMRIPFKKEKPYVNANALLYGKYCEELQKAFCTMLKNKTRCFTADQEKIKTLTDNINKFDIFVDPTAKNKWLINKTEKEFNAIKAEVASMHEDQGQLCAEVLRNLQPLINAAGAESVWVGFIDDVPVIGTVKEGVEWILAVNEGNEAEAKEKLEAVLEFLEESVEENTTTPSASTESLEAAGASESGPAGLKEVEGSKLSEYVTRCKTQRASVKDAIKKNIEKKLERIGIKVNLQNYYLNLLQKPKGSGRVEYVFNRDTLHFRRNVLNKAVEKGYFPGLRGASSHVVDQRIEALDNHPFDDKTKNEIDEHMAFKFGESESHVNVNAVLYDIVSQLLIGPFTKMMKVEYGGRDYDEQIETVDKCIRLMNEQQLYVDPFVREMWIGDDPVRALMFLSVRESVRTMYRTQQDSPCAIRVTEDMKEIQYIPEDFCY